jgi:hypothetical protein
MSVVRTKKSKEKPFVMLDTTALNDDRLSYRAKGIHTYLMSKPDGWQVYIEQLEHSSPREGRDAIRSALAELQKAGYLHREKLRGAKGRMAGWDTTIYETPTLADQEMHASSSTETIGLTATTSPKSDQPKSDQPKSDQPKSANPLLVSIEKKQVLIVENIEESNPPVATATSPAVLTPEQLVAMYNADTPTSHPKIKTLSPARLAKAKQYLRMFPDPAWWSEVFAHIGASPFLRGEKVSNGHGGWRADFDWLLSKGKDGTENCVKVAEGKYDETPAEAAYARLGEKGYRTALATQRILEEHAHDLTGRGDLLPLPESSRHLLH